jgi:acyl-coenzyme A thioesterase PaaI-like protein
MCGAPNVVHGGIQATLLDEARTLDAADNVLTTSQARWLRLESS